MVLREPADTFEDYKQKRHKAEHSADFDRPYFSSDARLGGRTTLESYTELFKCGYNSVDDVNSDLSKGDFENFVQELIKDIPGVHPKLIEVLDPTRELFGILYTEPENEAWGEGHIRVVEEKSPLSFIKAKQPSRGRESLWFHCSEPWDSLGFSEPSHRLIVGEVTPEQLNRKLAKIINDRGGLSLPTDYKYLLD